MTKLKTQIHAHMHSESISIRDYNVAILECHSVQEVRKKISQTLANYAHLLPKSRNAKILLKPNLNSNMNALTGNTTDLRILVAVIDFLKKSGYKNIAVGDGTSSGFYRNKISVAKRLRIDKVVEKFNIEFIDLNYETPLEIDFEDGVKANIAEICLKSDFFINIPKIKTHFETTMSVCLKNLIGCLVGLENKQKVHYNLYRNILHLNRKIKPDLHVVDSLIAMEGPGPSKGTPKKMDLIFVGVDPILIDLVCARIAGFDFREVHPLRVAEEQGLVTSRHLRYMSNPELSKYVERFRRPNVSTLVKFVNNQRWQKHFIKFRLAKGVNSIFNSKLAGKILNFSNLRQDVFIMKDDQIHSLVCNIVKCDHCGICSKYCPIALNLPEDIGNAEKGCISCLYCFFVCPKKAVVFKGDLGFLKAQIEQYGKVINKMVNDPKDAMQRTLA